MMPKTSDGYQLLPSWKKFKISRQLVLGAVSGRGLSWKWLTGSSSAVSYAISFLTSSIPIKLVLSSAARIGIREYPAVSIYLKKFEFPCQNSSPVSLLTLSTVFLSITSSMDIVNTSSMGVITWDTGFALKSSTEPIISCSVWWASDSPSKM